MMRLLRSFCRRWTGCRPRRSRPVARVPSRYRVTRSASRRRTIWPRSSSRVTACGISRIARWIAARSKPRSVWRVGRRRSAIGSRGVHAYDDERQQQVIAVQGNAGFGDRVPLVLVITSDLQTFFAPEERNQAWIDGGMFAMSLVHALHSLGLASCCRTSPNRTCIASCMKLAISRSTKR